MTDNAPRPTAPATGLFGGGKPDPLVLARQCDAPTSTQRKSFAGLFRADTVELHAA